MARHHIIVILILLSACTDSKPTAVTESRFQENIDQKVWSLCDSLSANKLIKKQPELSLKMLQKELNNFPEGKDSSTHHWLKIYIGDTYIALHKPDSSRYYYDNALTYFEAHPQFLLPLTKCYSGLGNSMQLQHEDIFKANYYSTKAAALSMLPGADSIIPLTVRLRSLNDAATSNRYCRQYEQALHFAKSAYGIAYPQRNVDSRSYMRTINEITTCYINKGKYDSASIWIKKAESWNDTLKAEDMKADILYAWATFYYYQQQYDSSLKYSQELAAIDNSGNLFGNLSNKLELYCLLHKKAEADECLTRILPLLDSVESDNEMLQFIDAKTLYLILYGNRQQAEQQFIDYKRMSRNFYDNERIKLYASIESEYNLADKQKNIDHLNKANVDANDRIRKKNNQLLLAILGILLFGMINIVLWLLSRQRKLRSQKQLLESEKYKIELEQRLLRTQMEPHFIFNTLNAMQSFVRNNENEKAIFYLNKFSRLLRISLENSRENYVLLSEEVEALQHYISLQAIRFENKFDYSLVLYAGFEEDEIKVPPMLLQPFVENAIYHGMKGAKNKGNIEIRIEKREQNLHCTISDNGGGLQLETATNRKSLAVRITQERLDIVSKETGKRASVAIYNKPSGSTGVVVELFIPYLEE